MAGDHQFLVGRDDVAGDARAFPRDARTAFGIRFSVELEPEPAEALDDSFANAGRVLADARGENQAVDAAHGRCEHPRRKGDAIDEVVERKLGARILAFEQIANVVADSGKPFKAAFVVEKALHVLRAHPFLIQQIEDDPGVELTGPGSHRQAVERSETQRALHALPGRNGAHRSAAAEMGDHGAALGKIGSDAWEPVGNVLVGQAVEAVTAHALVIERLGEGVTVGQFGVTAVKGRIEAGDLKELRLPRSHRADRAEIVRLMQRRKRRERIETLQHGLGDHRRRAVVRAAMHDTVANGGGKLADMRPQEPDHLVERGRYVLDLGSGPGLVDQGVAAHAARDQMGLYRHALDLTFQAPLEPIAGRDGEQLELDARAAGVDDENGLAHGLRPGSAAWRSGYGEAASPRLRTPGAYGHCRPARSG